MKKIRTLILLITVVLALAGCCVVSKICPVKPSAIPSPARISQPGEPLTPEEVDYYMAKIKANLTLERTGYPPENLADIEKFARTDDGKPFNMINLIKERKEVQYPAGWKGKRADLVIEAKHMYSRACYPLMVKSGTKSMLGIANPGPAVVYSGATPEKWDQFYLIAYPHRKAFMELLSSDAYADAIVHKYAGDQETLLIPVTAGINNFQKPFPDVQPMTAAEVESYMKRFLGNLTIERTGHPAENVEDIRKFALSDDGKPFFMINLIREHKDVQYPASWKGERAEFVLEAKMMYSRACYPIMVKSGAYSTIGVNFAYPAVVYKGATPEKWDQFYLIGYPSRRAFMELLVTEAYANAIVHKYAGDKDTLLIPVYGATPVLPEEPPAAK